VRVLLLTAEPINADVLRDAIGSGTAGEAEVMVVAPALQTSKLRFWMSDADDAIARAEEVQEETVERLEEEGIDAAGDTGEGDPLLAIQDALASFPADRIVVLSHPDGRRALGEEKLAEAHRRFSVPVEYRVVE
jgi:nucleotide-binding universal stress UspA family protein